MMKKKIKLISGSIVALLLSSVTLASCSSGSKIPYDKVKGEEVERTTRNVYVAPNAKGNGTSESSPTDFETAFNNAAPGDNILLAAGRYEYADRLQLSKSGEEYNYITVKPVSDSARVIFDFSSQEFNGSNRGIQIYGDYWKIYGVEVMGAGDNGMYIVYSITIEILVYN